MRRLRNNSGLTDDTVRAIEKAVMPPGGVGSYDLRIGRSSSRTGGHVKGRAYWSGSGYHDTARPFVNAYIGGTFPAPPQPERARAGYLPIPWLADETEALVYLLAHELRHLWQARVPRGRRVWGARGQFSERDADAYAIRALRRWRKER